MQCFGRIGKMGAWAILAIWVTWAGCNPAAGAENAKADDAKQVNLVAKNGNLDAWHADKTDWMIVDQVAVHSENPKLLAVV